MGESAGTTPTWTGGGSRESRRRVGEDARRRVPHEAHATWTPSDARDPIGLLREQAATRMPDLVPMRYARMAVSPFTYYRGAALPMAADLAGSPTSGITVQLGGDAHLSNFGLFASPERDLLFDMNDFDETLQGPWEWDVKRLAGSMVLAARSLGVARHDAHHAALETVRAYQHRMAEYAAMRSMDVYYSRVDASEILADVAKKARAFVRSTVDSATIHDALHEVPKLTEVDTTGRRRIVDRPPTTFHHLEIDRASEAGILDAYADTLRDDRQTLLRRFAIVDAAIKVVGVGSVGLIAGVLLLDGGDGEDPLFLQLKQAEASVLERYLSPSPFAHHGQRVVTGQRRLQANSDILLGWTTGPEGRHLYVRQLQDQKAGAVVDAMTLANLDVWGGLCGWTLARGHARSGDPVAIAGYLGDDVSFAHAIADFSVTYADQTERDHGALVAAINAGQLPTDPAA